MIEPRVYEKIGRSLAKDSKYMVHIFGSYPTEKSSYPNLQLHPHSISRSSFFQRLIYPWKLYPKIKKIKPNLVIVTTHELLPIGLWLKLFTGCKLIYDIQENYFKNLIFQRSYPWGIKHLLALIIRFREIVITRLYNHFILAEKCYSDEISFIGNRYTILENKFALPDLPIKLKKQDKITLLLSGTISKEYGVLEAIKFFKQLPPDEFELTMVGHCPVNQTLVEINNLTDGLDNINNLVSTEPIPHSQIIKEIGEKTIGILPYQHNKSTQNKVPTKLYEYIGLGIPVLISPNPVWESIINEFNAGYIVDFSVPPQIDAIRNSFTLISDRLSIDLKHLMWKNEESKLKALIQEIL